MKDTKRGLLFDVALSSEREKKLMVARPTIFSAPHELVFFFFFGEKE